MRTGLNIVEFQEGEARILKAYDKQRRFAIQLTSCFGM
jgi:hypothetical protein